MNSPGGNTTGGIAVYNAMRSMPYEITTHNIASVDSIGNVIFLGGTKRFACPASTFMFHGVGFLGNASERLEEWNLKAKLDTLQADHGRISTIMADRTKLSVSECMTLFEKQSTKEPKWALEKGIISEIKDLSLPSGANFQIIA